MPSRPWRSSPLAGPALSTIPPVIFESSEESDLPRTRSASIVSQTGSLSASASGFASRNTSSSASALALADGEGEASTSSVSLAASTGACGMSSSQGHASSQNHPPRWAKSRGRRPSSAHGDPAAPKNTNDVFVTPPPRARTLSHGHSRPVSFPMQPITPHPTIPQIYSRSSPRPPSSDSDSNTTKQPPSKSRDPASNWMSSSPFGPAQTPKFSRLAMASPAVIMPLSAREYRKQKARESFGKGKEKESSNRVTFIDNAISAFPTPGGVPVVRVSPPKSEDVHPPPSSSDHNSDHRAQPQPQVDHPPAKPLPQPSMSPRPSSPKQRRPRSRPHTPPRSSPLASHPPISPKSSAGTFFSFVSSSDEDNPNAVPPPRPRPRPRRRKSYPDRLSNGARLSLLEAMNRLSQESASLHRLSQTDGINRLSLASQASGHTLFYDVAESEGEGEQGQVTSGNKLRNGNGSEHAAGGGVGARVGASPALHTQSLEDLLSTLTRTGIEVVRTEGGSGDPLDEERKGKRNVRMVRISDTVEVSPPPAPRRRKLTKSRPGPLRGATPSLGARPVQEINEVKAQPQTHERRTSLLPWRTKGSTDGKAGERDVSMPIKGLVDRNEATTTSIPHLVSPITNGSAHIENHSKSKFGGPTKKSFPDAPAPSPDPEPPRKSRRYTFSFLPSPVFHRPKREKSNTAPPSVNLGVDLTKGKSKGNTKSMENGTDSTSTSIRTITLGSQSTLQPTHDLTTLASSGDLSPSARGSRSLVPMLHRVNAREMETGGEWPTKGDSTPSLITNGSTATSSSSPRTPSFVRLGGGVGGGGEPFVPRPSRLKASHTDSTSEEDSEDLSGGRPSRMCMHRKEPSPLARGTVAWSETSEGDGRSLCAKTNASASANVGPRPGSRPGTASSTLTTATETSGSYLSFSTVPASTTSSSSTSRSESPTPGDKRDPGVSMQGGDENEDEIVHTCAMCGHQSMSRASLPLRELDLGEMHPMFTVPLVTVASSNVRPAIQGGMKRKSERHTSVPIPTAVLPTKRDSNQSHMHVNVNVNGPVRSTNAKNDSMMTLLPSPPASPSPPKVRKRRRPQTAPAGTGDVTLKFVEEAKAVRLRDGSVDAHVGLGLGADRVTKPKDKLGGESRFKAVLKGLLRWGA